MRGKRKKRIRKSNKEQEKVVQNDICVTENEGEKEKDRKKERKKIRISVGPNQCEIQQRRGNGKVNSKVEREGG